MGTISKDIVWHEDVYSLETSDPVKGGPTVWSGGTPIDGFSNAPIKQLSDRTLWLKENSFKIANKKTFIADVDFVPGVTDTLTLDFEISDKNSISVFFDTAYQQNTSFEVVGSDIVFSSPIPEGVLQVEVDQPIPLVMSSDTAAMRDSLERSESAAEIAQTNSLVAVNASATAEVSRQAAEDAADRASDAADAAQSSSNTLWVMEYADIGPGPYPDNLPIRVTNDPNDSVETPVNGLYIWDGTLSEPVRAAESAQPATKGEIARVSENIVTETIVPTDETTFAIVDNQGKMALQIDGAAKVNIPHLESGNLEAKQDGTVNIASMEMREEAFPGYVFVITDDENRVAFSIDENGTPTGSVSQSDFEQLENRVEILEQGGGESPESSSMGVGPIEMSDGVIYEVDLDGSLVEIFDPAPYQIDQTIPLKTVSKSLIGVWDKAVFGSRSPFAFTPPVPEKGKTEMTIPYSRKLIAIVLGIGQSNMVGAQGQVYDVYGEGFEPLAFMLNGTGAGVRITPDNTGASVGNEPIYDPNNSTALVPLEATSIGNRGTTATEGMAGQIHRILRERFGFDVTVVYINGGYGGRFQSAMAKGTRIYENNIAAIQRAYELAESQGYVAWAPFIHVVHGESDSTRSSYLSSIVTWQADYENDLKLITGQQSGIPFVCSQASTFTRSPEGTPVDEWNTNGVLAPFYAHRNAPDKFVLASPYYPYQMHTDMLHLHATTHPRIGESIAIAVENAVFGSASQGHLGPVDVEFDGTNQVTVTLNMDSVVDLTNPFVLPPEDGNWGFQIFDGVTGLPVEISNRELVDSRTVVLTTTEPIPSGARRGVGYALYGYTDPKTLGTQARGCIRSSQPMVISRLDGETLYYWLNHFFLEF